MENPENSEAENGGFFNSSRALSVPHSRNLPDICGSSGNNGPVKWGRVFFYDIRTATRYDGDCRFRNSDFGLIPVAVHGTTGRESGWFVLLPRFYSSGVSARFAIS
jgi:hypothetical protein